MTKEEFKMLAKGMRAVYTNDRFMPDNSSMKMWFILLQDIPYQTASMAVQKYMLTSKFPPTPAEIRELALEIQVGARPYWGDAWEHVRKAVRKFGAYQEKEALASLDDLTRQAVKRVGWLDICLSENISIERANFRMIFEQLASRAYEAVKLPTTLQRMIDAERGQINDGKGIFASGFEIGHDDRKQDDRN